MKQVVLYALFLLLLVGLLPLICLLPQASAAAAEAFSGPVLPAADSMPGAPPETASSEAACSEAAPPSPAPDAAPAEGTILLQDSDTGALLTPAVQEYLVGAAASEMPATWPDQALLAQMVASHSFVLYQKEHCENPAAGWIGVAPARMQGYLTPEVRAARWGEHAQEFEEKLQALAAQVSHVLVLYDGRPAAACYHAISRGRTEASQNVWEQALPYLQGVDSPLDKNAEGFAQSVEFTPQQMADALSAQLGITPDGDAGSWFGETQWYDTGYVRSIEICGQSVAGVKLRQALGLRSNCFSISLSDGNFFVSTHGYGHGVGLSQWGARLMAEQGAGWQEILAHYFPETTIGEAL